MKKILTLLVFIALWSCQKEDEEVVSNNPQPTSIQLFNLDDVPTITLELSVEQWNAFLTNYDLNSKNEKKVVSKFTFELNGQKIELDSIGVKMRGNTSRRRPEGVGGEMHNPINPDWHHCHFGLDFSKFRDAQRFEGLNKINLKWFKDDANYVREIYSYNLFDKFGVWTAPKASYCRLKINIKGDASPAYYGVYSMIESIDEDYIAKRQAQWTNTIGFLWKAGWSGSNNANFVSTASMGVEDVKMNDALSKYYAYDLKTREDELANAKTELTQFITDLNTKTGNDFQNWISQKMDVNLFLKTYATNVMLGMWDDYWVNGNNFYFYFAGNGKAYFIPYDYDNTLGTSQIIANSGTQNPLTWGNMSQSPLITKILDIPEYKTLYKNYISELIDPTNDLFAGDRSKIRILKWQNKISSYVSNDTGEDMLIEDKPASWGNQPNYRLLSGNSQGGSNGPANYFTSRTTTIPW